MDEQAGVPDAGVAVSDTLYNDNDKGACAWLRELIAGPLQTSSPPTSSATPGATSSPVSADGNSPCDGRGGPTTGPSGPGRVPVSRSAAPASSGAPPTSDTCGRLFGSSSPSADLQRSLESRLRARLDVNGSPEYALTWKRWDMPSGPPISALRASARRTSDSDCSGWPTPKVATGKYCYSGGDHSKVVWNLKGAAEHVAGWPTPAANQYGDNVEAEFARRARLAADPKYANGNGAGVTLPLAAKTVTGWATPSARDHEDTPGMASAVTNPDGSTRLRMDQLPRQAGTTSSSSSASSPPGMAEPKPSGDGRRLNPRHSLWLMGYPAAWASCGGRAMQSSRNSRRRSSGPTSKRKAEAA